MRLINLMTEKNHYLEKFYSLNESEFLNFIKGDYNGIDSFYQARERILDIISYIDQEIEKVHVDMGDPFELSQKEKAKIKEALAVKDEYVARILAQDLEILSCIEKAKNNIIKELQDIRKGRKAVTGYKTKVQGQRLDEEA
jgi:predicted house-cleaning noncanonical NTP pyrophosphatase (MazG superfamily)